MTRPVFVFDGDCGFCRFWVERWRCRTGDRLDYQASAEKPRASRYIDDRGRECEAAEAVFRALADCGGSRVGLLMYERVPGFAAIAELAYRFIADHRPLADRIRKWCWGAVPEPSSYCTSSWLFLRVVGLAYLFAFWSLGTQVSGLIGGGGIEPAALYMSAARSFVASEHIGLDRFRLLPTLAWISTSDGFLRGLCVAGAAMSALLAAGIGSAALLPLLWLFYLSLSVVSREFLGYQWDALLLETGLIAVFLAPVVLRERRRDHDGTPRLARWLLLWLLFRLMIGSGAVKLASGDATWSGLTALTVHYETQPIPTPVAWWAHQLPIWFQKASTLGVFVIELGVPWLMLGPRRVRALAAIAMIGLQALIALTGNYAFFNLLTASLCVLLFDDAALGSKNGRSARLSAERKDHAAIAPVRQWATVAFAIVTVPVSLLMFTGSIGVPLPAASLVIPVAEFVQPFRSINSYGLFAVMTTTRDEIIVEGSNDGSEWKEYEFRYKPGDVNRRPPWVAPHQPRLDWQMWFAALQPFESGGWFHRFCLRLLEGSPEVTTLLATNPFPDHPPKYIRGSLYRYHFTSLQTGRRTGAWWTRDRIGEYSPPISLGAMLQ